jgi:hypothetical protein
VTIGIGGLTIRLQGLGAVAPSARRRYARFLVENEPDLTLQLRMTRDGEHRPAGMPDVTREGTGYRIVYGTLDASFDGSSGQATLAPSIWLVDSLLRIVVGLMLAERGGLLVHGSGVMIGEEALVCFGPSGVGKTTVARSVARGAVLCDEMIAIAGGRAFGTPFHGDYAFCTPRSAPLAAVVRLVQGSIDQLDALSPAVAAQSLLGSTLFFCRDEALAESLLTTALAVCTRRAYRLTFQRGTHVPTFVSQRLAAPGSFAQAAGTGHAR